ncbi:hypothetical protein ABF86_01870 [Nitrosomonas sp. GH22]|uniref:hypothetical protein n=1 Tax=Nitrosomonas TaxID=914 RepID=UPI0002E567BA|nr:MULTISPECIES: hypothetical protein [Nitrosomonas]MXS79535.1 hypothetical protein [Nitrosomonas sp. GH22]
MFSATNNQQFPREQADITAFSVLSVCKSIAIFHPYSRDRSSTEMKSYISILIKATRTLTGKLAVSLSASS